MLRAFHDARGVVERAFGEIGIQVRWLPANGAPKECSRDGTRQVIVVGLDWGAYRARSEDTLGYANPAGQGVCVVLLMDRLSPLIREGAFAGGRLLGCVLAHEIGHVMEGSRRHSDRGLMLSYLQPDHLGWAGTRLSFADTDRKLILQALQRPVASRQP